jgi:hypothetical protein
MAGSVFESKAKIIYKPERSSCVDELLVYKEKALTGIINLPGLCFT